MNLKIELEKAVEAYNNGSAEIKKLLIDLHGEEHFLIDIKDRVKGYKDALKVLCRHGLTLDAFTLGRSDKQAKREFARHKIVTVIEAINEGWIPNWDNENEYKWFNYFRNKSRGFSSGSYYYNVCNSGSDLAIQSSDKADYVALIMREEYIEFLY